MRAMPDHPASPDAHRQEAQALADLPQDELLGYAQELGLDLEEKASRNEMVRRIRAHQGLLIGLDRDALLDVIVWSRRPVRRSAGKEELAREIARIKQTNYDSLSRRGIVTLALLRGIPASELDNAEDLIARLKRQDGLWGRLRRKRRSLAASLVARLIEHDSSAQAGEYRFLPEDPPQPGQAARESLKTQMQEHGVVGGLATRLRGAADDYVRIKMDEIEARIDAKLDAIDRRLAEWRDREVSNRLKILRITLIFSVLVAVLSLGYNMIKVGIGVESPPDAVEPSGQNDAHPTGIDSGEPIAACLRGSTQDNV